MKGNQNNRDNSLEEDSIDVIAIVKNIKREIRLIIKVVFSFFIFGIIIAIISPTVYTSSTTFVPQVSDDQMSISKNGLGSLATLAGINLKTNESTTDSYISPLLYEKIINSEEFSLNILPEELIKSSGEKLTVKEYLLSKESSFNFNLFGFVKKYTVGLFLKNETQIVKDDMFENYNFINQEDYNLISSFRKKFNIELNEDEGYIIVFATDENAFISSQIVEKITKNLQSRIIELRTNKIRERLEYSKEQYELKQFEFDLLQKKLAEFKDSNKNISTASFRSELQKLESEYQLQQNILINLASEYNGNKIKLNKNTPIFSVIDEVSIPNERSAPKRTKTVLIFTLIGITVSLGYVLSIEHILNLVKEIKD